MEATHFDETSANLNAAESHVGGMRDILHKQNKHVKVIHSLLCCCQALVIRKHVSGDQHQRSNSQALRSHAGQQVQICWSAGFEEVPSPPLPSPPLPSPPLPSPLLGKCLWLYVPDGNLILTSKPVQHDRMHDAPTPALFEPQVCRLMVLTWISRLLISRLERWQASDALS